MELCTSGNTGFWTQLITRIPKHSYFQSRNLWWQLLKTVGYTLTASLQKRGKEVIQQVCKNGEKREQQKGLWKDYHWNIEQNKARDPQNLDDPSVASQRYEQCSMTQSPMKIKSEVSSVFNENQAGPLLKTFFSIPVFWKQNIFTLPALY